MAEVVFFTSGSTGDPKRIVRESEQLDADAAALAKCFRATLGAAKAFVASIREEHLYGALWRSRVPGALGLVCEDSIVVSVEELAELVARHGRIAFVTTPSFLEKALSHPDFPALRGGFADIVTSGSALRAETALAVAEVTGVCPLEIYGSTETGTIGWRRRTEGGEATLFDGVEAECDESGRLRITDSPYAMELPFTMSDAVRFTGPRRFELLGRTDRLVKVLEDFVSLTAVERAFEAHRFISAARAETFGDGVPRIGLVAVASAEGRAALAGGTFARVASVLRRELAGGLGAGFPRRIRFVRELPVDGRGKTTAALVRGTLSRNCREPVVCIWQATAERLSAELVFPSDTEVFDGHFPGRPVLPGVAQLYFLGYFARQVFADFPEAGVYRRLKFRRMVRPGERVTMEVVRKGPAEYAFSLAVAGEIAASGTLEGEKS